jgi:alkylation response protein AidB-like acyl-CoA dehydrogenase
VLSILGAPDGTSHLTDAKGERLINAVFDLGYSEQMIEDTIHYTKAHTLADRPISSYQANRHGLAEIATEIELTRTALRHYSGEYMAGQDVTKEVSMLKFYAAELSKRVANAFTELHGPSGWLNNCWICKAYADVRCHSIAASTTGIMKDIMAQRMGL